MMKTIEEVGESKEKTFALFAEGRQEKARELGALKRARNIKTAEDLLMPRSCSHRLRTYSVEQFFCPVN